MMKLPFLSHSKSLDSNLSSSLPPWTWPACANIKTLSFRDSNDPFRTFNSAFLDTEPDSLFTFSSSSLSDSTFVSDNDQADPVESVIRGLRSDRLFFHPEQSSSLLSSSLVDGTHQIESEQVENDNVGYQESEILSMESSNPYEDFRKSMEEMVEAHGLKDWQKLEELLSCYLKINGHHNHGIIVGAFIDLLVSLSFASSTSASTSTSTSTSSSSSSSSSSSTSSSLSSSLSSPSTCLTTPCLSPILDHGDDDDDDNNSKHDKHVDDFVSSLMN